MTLDGLPNLKMPRHSISSLQQLQLSRRFITVCSLSLAYISFGTRSFRALAALAKTLMPWLIHTPPRQFGDFVIQVFATCTRPYFSYDERGHVNGAFA